MNDMGLELKVARVRARATQRDVAVAMGLSQVRISDMENQRRVRPRTAERYMKALEEIQAEQSDEAAR